MFSRRNILIVCIIISLSFLVIFSPISAADVRTYGAVGDGITDDTNAIQLAIDSLPHSGGIVFIPTGIYNISSTLTIRERRSIIIIGEGANETFAVGSFSAEGTVLRWVGGDDALFKLTGVENLEISDLSLDGGNITGSIGIEVLTSVPIDTSSILFSRLAICYFTKGIKLSAFGASNVDTSVIDDVTFRSNTTGITFEASQAVGWAIRNCHFINNTTTGIHLFNGGGCFIEGSSFSGSNTCINLTSISDGVEIRDCTFECGTDEKAISCSSTAGDPRMLVRVTNCRIDANALQDLVCWTGQASLFMDGNRIKNGTVRLNNAISNSSIEVVHTLIGNWFQATASLELDAPTAADRAYLVFEYNNQRTLDEASGVSPVLRLRRGTQAAGIETEWELSRNGLRTRRCLNVEGISGTLINANNLRGSVTIADNNGNANVYFNTVEPDTNYFITAVVSATSGGPPVDATRVYITNKATTGFVVNLEGAPGLNKSVTVDWILVR